MTVAAEAPAADGANRDVADQLFSELFQEHWDHLCRFIRARLDDRHHHMTEDLAQETFICLWRTYVSKGTVGNRETVFVLLAVIARTTVAKVYVPRQTRPTDTPVDFADPANHPIVETGHIYPATSPDVSALGNELDEAMEYMTGCSKSWRDKHKESHFCRQTLATNHLGPAKRQQMADRLSAVVVAESAALEKFQEACQRVGTLRAELEATAGPGWRSSMGLNPGAASKEADRSYRRDPTVKHCSNGHLLDRDNTSFQEDGRRQCRLCRQDLEQAAKDGTSAGRAPVYSKAVIETARQMLLDPTNTMTVTEIAESLGFTAVSALYRRIPGLAAMRRAAREAALVAAS